tara:strand:- start:194 stop:541 length:348 start_codon:yes stop_codon:yes gene_type:complete
MDYRSLSIGVALFIVAHIAVWYQVNGQFLDEWVREHTWVMTLFGIPISWLYLYSTRYTVEAFGGELWPQRLIGFAIGMIAFTILTYIHLGETINLKIITTLTLSLAIVLVQILWK